MKENEFGMIAYRPATKPDGLLIGKLFYSTTTIYKTRFYEMADGSAAVEYHDSTTRLINSNWYDDQNFTEPSDEDIEKIVEQCLSLILFELGCVSLRGIDADNKTEIRIQYANEILKQR